MKENASIQFGILGGGRIGRMHAENIMYRIRDAQLSAVYDPFIEHLEEWAVNHSLTCLTNEENDVLQNPDIDAVLICSPTHTHADFAIKAAKCGKHIFCEKPVDLDIKRIQEVKAVMDQSSVVFQVGFNRRFDKSFEKLKSTIVSGEVGDVQIIKVTSRDPMPPPLNYVENSGGLFLDMTIHDFDMVRFLSGSEFVNVHAYGQAVIDPSLSEHGDIDTAVTSGVLENGALVVIDNSRKASYGYDQRIEVFGSEGKAVVENMRPTTIEVSTNEGVYKDKPEYFFLERYKESFVTEIESFISAIKNQYPSAVSVDDGLKAAEIAVAATRSLQQKKKLLV
ncbi:inositol 2-dehydrogenase [Halobacillus sp. Cin3]|uniref:inositol 2-dehydrogenase n=1 Tax=Halobacillus sp. Cin3 TaxID=2928441 RepID=UPI00248E45E6|nr:inositol 2-dehydrogenase [Halobacillus sp. Cin3]